MKISSREIFTDLPGFLLGVAVIVILPPQHY